MTSVQPPQWNGSCGSHWAAVQDVVDRLFVAVRLLAHPSARAGLAAEAVAHAGFRHEVTRS